MTVEDQYWKSSIYPLKYFSQKLGGGRTRLLDIKSYMKSFKQGYETVYSEKNLITGSKMLFFDVVSY